VSAFEFFTVLLSFVVSLGVAGLLTAVIRLVQEASRVSFSLTWALWAAASFTVQINFWLRAWTYHENYALRIETSVPPLVLAIIAFFISGLATPHIPDTGPIDLRDFHARQGPKYQIAYAAFMLVAIVQGVLMNSTTAPGFLIDTISQITMAAACIAAAIYSRIRWLQLAVPTGLLIGSTIYYASIFAAGLMDH
jgi:hypothetical protein